MKKQGVKINRHIELSKNITAYVDTYRDSRYNQRYSIKFSSSSSKIEMDFEVLLTKSQIKRIRKAINNVLENRLQYDLIKHRR